MQRMARGGHPNGPRSGVMKRIIFKFVLPWLITLVALYLAFHEVSLESIRTYVGGSRKVYLVGVVVLTILSYILRAARWPLLFPNTNLPFGASYRVLVLGFFMNNILPARAGELVRAHLGGKVVGQARTLVLATIASERLADGLAISLMFALIITIFGRGQLDPVYAQNLTYVAYIFAGVAIAVIGVLLMRNRIFAFTDKVAERIDHKASTYTLSRVQMFIHGLSPLCSPSRALKIALWSTVIWLVELGAFACVAAAYNSPLSLSGTVLFLVAVNFSSLIPAAPGGFGVIELVALKVLTSAGVEPKALALCMVLTQHLIQYIVIGVPGAFLLSTLRAQLRDMAESAQSGDSGVPGRHEAA